MKIAVFANGAGDGEGSHVSVCASIIEGNNIMMNCIPIGNVTVEQLNQLEDKNHHSDTIRCTPE